MHPIPRKRRQHPEVSIEPECYFNQELKCDSESSKICFVVVFVSFPVMKHFGQNIATNVCYIDMLSIDISNEQDIGFVVSVALWNRQNKV